MKECPNCQMQIGNKAKSCKYCGSKITTRRPHKDFLIALMVGMSLALLIAVMRLADPPNMGNTPIAIKMFMNDLKFRFITNIFIWTAITWIVLKGWAKNRGITAMIFILLIAITFILSQGPSVDVSAIPTRDQRRIAQDTERSTIYYYATKTPCWHQDRDCSQPNFQATMQAMP